MSFLDRFRKKPEPEGPQYERPGYPDGGPFVGESSETYHDRKWRELNSVTRREAVEYLRKTLAPETIEEWKKEMNKGEDKWWAEHHFFAGMGFRNLLRKAVKDDRLPTGNWDDYWVAALEAACGERNY